MGARFLIVLVSIAIAAWAEQTGCTPVLIDETAIAACANGVDDNGDGRVDCADPSCQAAGICETSALTCKDGADNDGDGLTDCQQAACISAGYCADVPAECDLHANKGCPVGTTCVFGVEGRVGCSLEGIVGVGGACDASTRRCGRGLSCIDGLCRAPCYSDWDCCRATKCAFRAPDEPGFCAVPCVVGFGSCANGSECTSPELFGVPFDGGGYQWWCEQLPFAGQAKNGDRCVDPLRQGLALTDICEPDRLCVPDGDGFAYCRTPCAILDSGVELLPCPAGEACVPIRPFDPRPVCQSVTAVPGVCLAQ